MASQRRAGVLLGYANIAIKNIVNLLYTPMLLAFVGRGDYGVFQTSNSFIYSLTLLSFGFSGAYVRFYTQRNTSGDEDGILKLNGMYLLLYLAIDAVALALGLFCSANVGVVFSQSFTPQEVGLAGAIMAIMTFNVATTLLSTVFDAYVIVHEQFVFQQTRQMLTTLATPGMALLLLNLGMGVVGVAAAQLTVSLTLLALNVRFAVGRLGMRFDFRHLDWTLLGAVAAFSAWIFANQVCDLVNQNVPNVVLGAICGSTTVAVFAVAVQIRHVFISLSTIISNTFVPQINRIVAESNDNTKLTRVMTKVGRYQMLLLAWVYGGFVVLGRFFIGRWAGKGFADAYWMILAMVLFLLIPLSQNVGIEIQKAKNMHRARSVAYLVMAVFNVAFTLLMAPRLGYWASAIAYTASIFLGNFLFMNWYYQTRIGLDMRSYWRAVVPVVVCAAVASATCLAATRVLPVSSWLRFLGWGGVYSCLYAALVFVLVLSKRERLKLAGLVRAAARGGKDD